MMKKKDQRQQGEQGKRRMKGRQHDAEHVEKPLTSLKKNWCVEHIRRIPRAISSWVDAIRRRQRKMRCTGRRPTDARSVLFLHRITNATIKDTLQISTTLGVIMNGGENSNDATNDCVTLPQTRAQRRRWRGRFYRRRK